MIRVVTTSKNPTMRYLARTHRVSVAWLHEVCQMKEIKLVYEATARTCADIFTKAFSSAASWRHACDLIQIVVPKVVLELVKFPDIGPEPPLSVSPERGGGGNQ